MEVAALADKAHRDSTLAPFCSDILIHCASLAYSRAPSFSLAAPGQPSNAELITMAFTGPQAIKKRRVRPRMTVLELQQPRDDDERRAEYGTEEAGNKAKL